MAPNKNKASKKAATFAPSNEGGGDVDANSAVPLLPRHARGKHRRSQSFSNRPTMPLERNSEQQQQVQLDRPAKKRASTRRRTLNVSIRPMLLKDISTVYRLGNEIFTAAEFPNLYRTWDDFSVVENFNGSPELCFCAFDENESIVGFLLGETMTKANVETRGYIQWVAVAEPYRRAGIATHLLEAFTKEAKKRDISLWLADTQSDNGPAIALLKQAGLHTTADHVYMTRQINSKDYPMEHVDRDGYFNFCYTASRKNEKQRITVRPMEIADLHPVYLIGESIFTQRSPNLYNFWDEHLVLQSYLSDPDLCVVATVKNKTDDAEEEEEIVVGFCFGTTIEKPRSSWKYGYLVWLGCSDNYQGLGLATQLYNVVVELFVLEKCRIVMIDTQRNNEGAIKFFRGKGFGNDEEHVYLSNST